jgi:hypothetical protein
MNAGPMVGVADGSAKDLVGQRRSVALPEKQEPKKISDRISFRPSEVNVWHVTGLLFEKNQHSGDCVRDRRTSRAQNRKRPDPFAADAQAICKLRSISG